MHVKDQCALKNYYKEFFFFYLYKDISRQDIKYYLNTIFMVNDSY